MTKKLLEEKVAALEATKVLIYHEASASFGEMELGTALQNGEVEIVGSAFVAELNKHTKAMANEQVAPAPVVVPEVKNDIQKGNVATMAWAIRNLKWQGKVSEDFLNGFDIWFNNQDKWVGILPKKVTAETTAFIKELMDCGRKQNRKTNWWKNTGCYFKFTL